MDNEKADIIIGKLDMVIGLLATQGKVIDDQIKILRSIGFTIKQISELTGLPDGTIKSKMRKDRLSL